MATQDLSIPEPSAGDIAHTSVTTLLSLIPFAAGAGELFKLIVSPPVDRRREEWMRNVVDAIRDLQRHKAIDIDSLQQNEEFITLLIKASQIAVQTHLTEKHLMLKNALINSVLTETDFDTETIYLGLIEQLTIAHLHILKFISEYKDLLVEIDSFEGLYNLLTGKSKHPSASFELLKDFHLSEFRVYLKDLEQAGVILLSDTFLKMQGQVSSQSFLLLESSGSSGLPHARITGFGTRFLLFVRSSERI